MEGCQSESHCTLPGGRNDHEGSAQDISSEIADSFTPVSDHGKSNVHQLFVGGMGNRICPVDHKSPLSGSYFGHDGFAGFLQDRADTGNQYGMLQQKINGAIGRKMTYGTVPGKHALRQQARRRRRNTCIAAGNSPPITRVTMKSGTSSAACSPSGLSPTNQQSNVSHSSSNRLSSKTALAPATATQSSGCPVFDSAGSSSRSDIETLVAENMAKIVVSKLNPNLLNRVSLESSFGPYSDLNAYIEQSRASLQGRDYANSLPRTSPVSVLLSAPSVRMSSRLTGASGSCSGMMQSGQSTSQNQLIITSFGTNQQSQGSRTLRICPPQSSPSTRDSSSPSMTIMQSYLASIPGFKPRKRSQRKLSTAAQLAQTREGSVDLETPDSILVNVNLKSLVNAETYASLLATYQHRLAQLLPRVDQVVAPDNSLRVAPAAFHNEFLARACVSWRERLREGEFTHDNQVKMKGEAEKERSKLDPWKVAHFEPVWGMKQGSCGEESEKDSGSLLDSLGDENDTSFSSSSSYNHSPASPVYSEEYFTQLTKVVEFIASRDQRRRERRESRRAERLKRLRETREHLVKKESDISYEIDSLESVSKHEMVASPMTEHRSMEEHVLQQEPCDRLALVDENTDTIQDYDDLGKVQHVEANVVTNIQLKRKGSPVMNDHVGKKSCSQEYSAVYSVLPQPPCEKLNNDTIPFEVSDSVQSAESHDTEGCDANCDMENFSVNDHTYVDQFISDPGSSVKEQDTQGADEVNNTKSDDSCDSENKGQISDNSDSIRIDRLSSHENSGQIHTSNISRSSNIETVSHRPLTNIVRVIPSVQVFSGSGPLHYSGSTVVQPTSQTSVSPVSSSTFLASPPAQNTYSVEVTSCCVSPKPVRGSPGHQITAQPARITTSPISVVFSKPSNTPTVSLPNRPMQATSSPISSPYKKSGKGAQGSSYGSPVTLRISKTQPQGVNLQRSYEIVHGLIANIANKDQLQAQLRSNNVLLVDSKSSATINSPVSPTKFSLNPLREQVTSSKELPQQSAQHTSQFVTPKGVPVSTVTPHTLAVMKALSSSNGQFTHTVSQSPTSVSQIIPAGQRIFRTVPVAIPFTAVDSTGNTMRIRPVTPQAGVSQTESIHLGTTLQSLQQSQEGCRPPLSGNGPITILRPASGGKPVYLRTLRTLSVSNIQLVRVSDILSSSRADGDQQQPPRASSAPPGRNNIVALTSVLPRPNSVGPRILMPATSGTQSLVPSTTPSPTHHFLSEGDPSSGVINIDSNETLSIEQEEVKIDEAVDMETRAGANKLDVVDTQMFSGYVNSDGVQFCTQQRTNSNEQYITAQNETLETQTMQHNSNYDNFIQNEVSNLQNSEQDNGSDNPPNEACVEQNMEDHNAVQEQSNSEHSDSCENISHVATSNDDSSSTIEEAEENNVQYSSEEGYEEQSDLTGNGDQEAEFVKKDMSLCGHSEEFTEHFVKNDDNFDSLMNSELKEEENHLLMKEDVKEEEEEDQEAEFVKNEMSLCGHSEEFTEDNFDSLMNTELKEEENQLLMKEEEEEDTRQLEQFSDEAQDDDNIISDYNLSDSSVKLEHQGQQAFCNTQAAAYQIIPHNASHEVLEQQMLQKQAFFIQQQQHQVTSPLAPAQQQGPTMHAQNVYHNIPLNPVPLQQISNQSMALNIQTFANVNNNQMSNTGPHSLGMIPVDNDGGGSSDGNEDGCPCNMRAMVACMKCGAFCHHDCVSPNRLCVTCLIR